MSRSFVFSLLAALALPALAGAKPPDHAPAHGYRSKQHDQRHDHGSRPGGFSVVFDQERGVSVAVDFPGVYFVAGSFYRMHEGRWQVSGRADGGWSGVRAIALPDAVRRAGAHPGPAKPKKKHP